MLASILLSVVVCCLMGAVLFWSRRSWYRVDEADLRQLLQSVILGQANANEWQVFIEMPIRYDPFLDDIRESCRVIDEAHQPVSEARQYLLDGEGVEKIRELLEKLDKERPEKPLL